MIEELTTIKDRDAMQPERVDVRAEVSGGHQDVHTIQLHHI